jgi:peptide/nickel transport system substrate-binding protein
VRSEGQEYLFYLRPEIEWQDGTPFKPKQVDYQISGAEITALENGVKIKTDSVFSPLPTFLNQPLFKEKNIGLGPYRIKKIKVSSGSLSSLLLAQTSNPQQRIRFKFYPNESSLITAFKLGEIDEAWGISNINVFQEWESVDIKTTQSGEERYVAFFVNSRESNPPFTEKRVRQALAYAVEKPPEEDRAISPIQPSSWAYNDGVKAYNFNPARARELLQESWDLDNKLTIQLYTLPELLNWAEKAKENWQTILNADCNIQVTSFVPSEEEFDVYLGYGVIPPDPDQYFFWHSTQQGNITGINSPRIDQLLEKGRKTLDSLERQEIYYEFQQALSEESPAIFLFYPSNYIISRN